MQQKVGLRLCLASLLLCLASLPELALARLAVAPAATASVSLAALPAEAIKTYRLIHLGGPFKSEKDGVVFGNRERLLPLKTRGFYLEYTVPTPGLRQRGAKRIVCAGPARAPQSCYYSGDHYASFRKIVP